MSSIGAPIEARLCRAFASIFAGAPRKPAIEAEVRAGEFGMRIGFASRELADAYLRSFLGNAPAHIDLTLAVLTSDDIDLSNLIPDPPGRGRVYVGDEYIAVWHADRLPILYLLDRQARRGIVWFAKGTAPRWEFIRPACPLIHAAAMDGPWATAHGGAIGLDGRVLMLVGKGRAGKTTAALACARAGWDYAGDDYIFVNTVTGQIAPLYQSARLRLDLAGAFTDLLPIASHTISHDHGDTRHELGLSGLLGSDRIKGGKLAAILLPRRRGARLPEFAPARRADAFQILLMTSTHGVPWPLASSGKKFSALVGLAPTFFVDTGESLEAIPNAFATFLARL